MITIISTTTDDMKILKKLRVFTIPTYLRRNKKQNIIIIITYYKILAPTYVKLGAVTHTHIMNCCPQTRIEDIRLTFFDQ